MVMMGMVLCVTRRSCAEDTDSKTTKSPLVPPPMHPPTCIIISRSTWLSKMAFSRHCSNILPAVGEVACFFFCHCLTSQLVCVHVHACVCLCVYVYAYVHIYACACVCPRICVFVGRTRVHEHGDEVIVYFWVRKLNLIIIVTLSIKICNSHYCLSLHII